MPSALNFVCETRRDRPPASMKVLTWLVWMAVAACQLSPDVDEIEQAVEGPAEVALERTAIARWIARDTAGLATVEAALDVELRRSFALGTATAAGSERVLRAALVEWARDVRRFSREPLHTTVVELAEDTDCRGSVIGDAALLDYVTQLTATQPHADRVATALADLARHMVCLSPAQSRDLAAAMVVAFDHVVGTLRIDRLSGVLPYLIQAVSQPMLIVHDVERQHGTGAPLARWFKAYEDILLDGRQTGHHPAWWTGVWLYDRVTGRLRGFAPTMHSANDNEVDLAALYMTVAAPAPSDYQCSFAEMVSRGLSVAGRYVCSGQACAAGDETACVKTGGGASGGPAEQGAVSLPGFATLGAVDCITQQAAHAPGRQQLTCVMEAMGLGASPLDSLTKNLAQVPLPGVKLGGFCQRGQAANAADHNYDRRVKRAEDDYQAAIDNATQALSVQIDRLADLQKVADTASQDYQNDPSQANADAEAQALTDVKEQAERVNKELLREVAAKQAAAEKLARDLAAAQAARDAENEAATGANTGSDGSNADAGTDHRCMDDRCGCTAMSAQTQAALDCIAGDPMRETFDPFTSSGGCGADCDPIDPDVGGAGLTCVEALGASELAPASASCWAVRCGSNDSSSPCCGGGGPIGGTPRLPNPCAWVACADGGQPTSVSGHCACGTDGGGLPGGPIAPQGTLGVPRLP